MNISSSDSSFGTQLLQLPAEYVQISLADVYGELRKRSVVNVSVQAMNSMGWGAFSPEVSTMVVDNPGAVTDVTARERHSSVLVSWSPPTDTGGAPDAVLSYFVESSLSASIDSLFSSYTVSSDTKFDVICRIYADISVLRLQTSWKVKCSISV